MVSAQRIEVIGAGRMGRALAAALRAAGYDVPAIGGRGATGSSADAVLLAVPDSAIAEAAARIEPGRLVGHLSGATTLDPLAPHEAFSLHPLLTVPRQEARSDTAAGDGFRGAYAAVAGSSDRALALAEELAAALGMRAFRVAEEDRGSYHAAASIASNFLITLEGIAERLGAVAGVPRAALIPLVEASVRNWAELGAAAALTGPVARGDEATVSAQRAALAEHEAESLEVFDALVAATRRLAGASTAGAGAAGAQAIEADAIAESGEGRA